MFSKKALSYLLMLVMTSCSYHLGESPPKQQDQRFQGTGCLSNVMPVVKDFGTGKAKDADLAGSWDCAISAIEKFKKYVRGRAADRYTSQELTDFLEENFLDRSTNPGFSPEFRQELMKFKQLFVGGTDTDLTRDEIDKTLVVFAHFKTICLELNPYMKVLSQNWSITDSHDVNSDIHYFENSATAIQQAATELAALISPNQQGYRLEDLVVFMQNLEKFNGETWQLTQEIQTYMPVVEKVKKAITGGDQAVVAPPEWQNFILIGVRGYLQYLRYFYFIKSTTDTSSGLRLTYLARSVEDLLGAFQDLLNGKPADPKCGYHRSPSGTSVPISCISRQDIQELLNTFAEVWSQFKVSDKLIDEGLKLKRVYFGGDLNSITSDDFARGKNKVDSLRLIGEKFLPYYAVYSKDWDRSGMDENMAQAFFLDAQKSLVTSAAQLGALFETSYDLQDLSDLLAEINRLYPQKKPDASGAIELQKYLPLSRDIKNILFSEKDTSIKKAEWTPLLSFASRFYALYLYEGYFVSGKTLGTLDFVQSFRTLSATALTTVRDIIQQKKGQIVSRTELESLAQHLEALGFLPKGLNSTSIDELVRDLLSRVLWPAEDRIAGHKAPDGLTTKSIDTASNELEIWAQTEQYVLSLTGSRALSPQELQRDLAKKLPETSAASPLRSGLQEMALMVDGPIAQTVNSHGHLIIGSVPQYYDTKSVSALNFNRALGRVFIRAASDDRSRLDHYQGVTLEEAKAFFEPIRPFFVQLRIIDPDNLTFIQSRFRDASIFVAHASGNTDLANFQQITDLMGMMFSGITVNGPIQKDVVAQCLPTGTVTDNKTTAPLNCLSRVYVAHLLSDTSSLPDFSKYFQQLNSDDRMFYFMGVLKTAGYEGGDNVKLSDAALVPHVAQYIEMIFERFDADHNSEIDTQEALNAFPLFHGLLSQLTKDQKLIKDEDLPALFTYILHYGQPPAGISDFVGKWLPWKWHKDTWVVNSDRTQLAGILGYIADQANKPKQILTPDEQKQVGEDPKYKDMYSH